MLIYIANLYNLSYNFVRYLYVISDKFEADMISISDKIMGRIKARGRGWLFTPKDFLDLGTRAAVDKALSRLSTQGDIRRLSRGLYDYPKKHKLMGLLWPSLHDVARAIAKDSNSQLQLTGAQALYVLGLTTQMPVKAIYLTDGYSKTIKIGNSTLKLQHVSPSIMAGSGKKSGLVLQAIRYIGKNRFTNDVMQKIIDMLDQKDKKQLMKLARFAPPWSRDYIYKLATT